MSWHNRRNVCSECKWFNKLYKYNSPDNKYEVADIGECKNREKIRWSYVKYNHPYDKKCFKGTVIA